MVLRQILILSPSELCRELSSLWIRTLHEIRTLYFVFLREMLKLVTESMLEIGFKKEEVEDVFSILAAVILIGDVVRTLFRPILPLLGVVYISLTHLLA